MRRILLHHIEQQSRTKPEGYVQRVLSSGVVKGDSLYIEDSEYEKLVEEYREPSTPELLGNFAAASLRWVLSGFALVSEPVFKARLEACAGNAKQTKCEYWDGEARLGMGKCRLCGCSKLKHWWASERCPKKKWPQ